MTNVKSNVSVPAGDPPAAVVRVKLAPDVRADRYRLLAPASSVAAAAFVGVQLILLVLVTDVFATTVEAAADSVNVPVTRGNVAKIASLRPLMATIISRC